MKEIQLIFFDNCNTCNQEYPDYEFIFGYPNMCIDCYCKLTKKQPKVVKSIKNFYKRIDDLGGTVIGEYKGSDIRVECRCKNDHLCNPNPESIQQGGGMCNECPRNSSEIAEQNFRDNIEKLGGTVIGEYKGSRIQVKCKCKNDHICNPAPNYIKRGYNMCNKGICKNTEKNFRDNIKKLGGTVIGKYIKSGIGVECICSKGHSCSPRPDSINQGQGMCGECAGNDSKISKRNFYDNIKKLGGTVIGEYIKSGMPVECRCKNDHICNPTPNSIQQRYGMCITCSGLDSETAKKNFYDNIKKLGGKVIGEYINNRTTVHCICSKGHHCNSCPDSVQQGVAMCRRCSKSKGYSKGAISWLNSISNTIQHAENGGEFKIPNIGKVDGYDHKTNTVYEYHGCYWHGCLRCFEPDYFNKRSKKTASELYNKTIERSLAIRNAGYNLIEMRECD